jgi:lysophospholipase L1-like esterase
MNLCFIGDSLVLGVGAPAGLGWPGRVCARSWIKHQDLTCFNLGIRAHSSLDVAARWKAEVAPRLPDGVKGGVFFSFGTADVAKSVPLDTTVATARAVLSESKGLYPTLFAGPCGATRADLAAGVPAVNAALMAVCAEVGVPALDLFATLGEHQAFLREIAAGDGAHPGAQGYDMITDLVLDWAPFQALLEG